MDIPYKTNQSNPVNKHNISNKVLLIIHTFDHEGTKVVITMNALKW